MSTNNTALYFHESDIIPKNPFLDALQEVDCGKLTLVTPDNKTVVFRGREEGPSAHWHLHDWEVLDDFLARGELGLADAYIDGRWTSSSIETLLTFGLLNAARLERFFHGRPFYALWLRLKYAFLKNSVRGSRRNIAAHYNLGNDFYRLWLDRSMTYSCALFEGDATRSLEAAQEAKYNRILDKLDAKPGQHILEIGCGWGGFAEIAAQRNLCVTAITLASSQADYARARLAKRHLEHLVDVQLMDYRKLRGQYDHIVSIGMFEHVGENYWPTYFSTIRKHLHKGGKAMVQSIILDDILFDKLRYTTGFLEYYIFPGGMLPSQSCFIAQAELAQLTCREIYRFGDDYTTTLTHWLDRFEQHIDEVRALGYDENFIRLWRFYLASCIASFRSKRTDVMQVEITH